LKALTWQGKRNVRVEDVPDPTIMEPTDVIVRVTSSGICGSDLHLYELLGPFLEPGDVLGHEAMGVVAEVGPEVTELRPDDRVVVPFNVSCRSTCRAVTASCAGRACSHSARRHTCTSTEPAPRPSSTPRSRTAGRSSCWA